jgi:hypothetical protein
MNFSRYLSAKLAALSRNPFLWWIGTYFFGTWSIASLLPPDGLSRNLWLQDFYTDMSDWMPWILKTATTFEKFPDVALFMLTLLWVTLPIQVGIIIWLSAISPILRAEIVPFSFKYPVRFPVGILAVVAILFYLLFTMNARDMAELSGWRASFFSYISESRAWFGFGAGLSFFATSLLTAIFFKSVFIINFSSYKLNNTRR